MSARARTAAILTLVSFLAVGCGAAGSGGEVAESRLIAPSDKGLYLIELDGSGSRLIPGTEGVPAPTWSPDGRLLAVSIGEFLYTMRPDGTDRRRVVENAFSPSWSPDGKRLAVMRDDCESETDYDGCMLALDNPFDIYTIGVDGSDARRLTSDPDYDGEPSWSPDGEQIAFTGGDGVYLMRSDGSDRRRLHPGIGLANPRWSPEGDVIAVNDFDDISVVDVETGKKTNLTRRQGPDFYPAWSPDGKQIAFLANSECLRTGQCTAHEPWEVWVMNADGTDVRRLTKGGFGAPAWG